MSTAEWVNLSTIILALLTLVLVMMIIGQTRREQYDMKKTLEWYADEDHYHSAPHAGDFKNWEPPLIYRDNGKRAREALGKGRRE